MVGTRSSDANRRWDRASKNRDRAARTSGLARSASCTNAVSELSPNPAQKLLSGAAPLTVVPDDSVPTCIVSRSESLASAESDALDENESGSATGDGVTESALGPCDVATRRALVSDSAWNAGATTTVGG